MHITTAPRTRTDDLLVVANTRHGPGGHYHARVLVDGPDHDHLADPLDATAYLADHAVPVPEGAPDPVTLRRLGVIRELVRRLAGDRGADGAPTTPPTDREVEAIIADVSFTLGADGLRPVRAGWAGFADALLPVLLDLRRDAAPLRVCGNPRCRFAFLDRSRNRSRVWCDSAACGNRVRVGRHRRARHVASGREASPASPASVTGRARPRSSGDGPRIRSTTSPR